MMMMMMQEEVGLEDLSRSDVLLRRRDALNPILNPSRSGCSRCLSPVFWISELG